jgi:hypothetical protein
MILKIFKSKEYLQYQIEEVPQKLEKTNQKGEKQKPNKRQQED